MDSSAGLSDWHTLDPVDTAFVLEIGINVLSADAEDYLFDHRVTMDNLWDGSGTRDSSKPSRVQDPLDITVDSLVRHKLDNCDLFYS